MFDIEYFVYIMTNPNNTTFYTGMTNNLAERVYKHKNKVNPNSFTARYNINKLVYYETFDYVYDAIAREKQIKAGSRKKKLDLIKSINPEFKDLSDEWYK